MSNADDRCAFRYSFGVCDAERSRHGVARWSHVFVEPAPQPEPSQRKRDFQALVDAVGPLPTSALATSGLQPESCGDEAKVREIANKWYAQYVGSHLPALQHGILPGAVRESYAAGKADGAREFVAMTNDRDNWLLAYQRMEKSRDDTARELAIARRGSCAHPSPCMREDCAVRAAEADPNYPADAIARRGSEGT